MKGNILVRLWNGWVGSAFALQLTLSACGRRPMCSFLVAVTLSAIAAQAAEPTRPNIVIILADDFGVGDIQAHFPENKIRTPHLDRFTKESIDRKSTRLNSSHGYI